MLKLHINRKNAIVRKRQAEGEVCEALKALYHFQYSSNLCQHMTLVMRIHCGWGMKMMFIEERMTSINGGENTIYFHIDTESYPTNSKLSRCNVP